MYILFFQVGMTLEVLKDENGGAFYAGYVHEVLNSHYFLVNVGVNLNGAMTVLLCSKSHDQIFPSGWCQRHGFRLTPPIG